MSTVPPSLPPISPMPVSGMNTALVLFRGVAGAAVGGAIGYFVFRWLSGQGFYGIMIPGALLGMGAGLAARTRSLVLGLICTALAIALTVFTEWHVLYSMNHTFDFFLSNIHTLKP